MTTGVPRHDRPRREVRGAGGAPDGAARGVLPKLFGVALMGLGALDAMLAWRGGFAVADFALALFAAGALLCFAGALRRREPR
ncbi:MAG: hypothetical protein M5U08_02835 [Burkholderiales bacterium]|nr:hypothetical protein [Burkholderiales bacterium]